MTWIAGEERPPGTREHAEVDRRFAEAEQAAAAAFRKHTVPADEVRPEIRDLTNRADPGDD